MGWPKCLLGWPKCLLGGESQRLVIMLRPVKHVDLGRVRGRVFGVFEAEIGCRSD